jgi:hypothetical protein
MRGVLIGAVVAVMAVVALAGCETADAPPGTPGSLHIHMNGQAAATVRVTH